MLVRIKKEWLNSEDEAKLVFEIVEDRGPRVLIREAREPRFPNELIPTESVMRDMIEEL